MQKQIPYCVHNEFWELKFILYLIVLSYYKAHVCIYPYISLLLNCRENIMNAKTITVIHNNVASPIQLPPLLSELKQIMQDNLISINENIMYEDEGNIILIENEHGYQEYLGTKTDKSVLVVGKTQEAFNKPTSKVFSIVESAEPQQNKHEEKNKKRI